jgi:hypothetical protein
MKMTSDSNSVWSLRFDLVSAKLLVWVVSLGRDAVLRPEADLYFFDRYMRLADVYDHRGNHAKARRLRAKAADHNPVGGGSGPPYAAAMALPRPRRWLVTDARSDKAFRPPDDAA